MIWISQAVLLCVSSAHLCWTLSSIHGQPWIGCWMDNQGKSFFTCLMSNRQLIRVIKANGPHASSYSLLGFFSGLLLLISQNSYVKECIFNCLAFHLSSLQEQQQRISPSVQEIFKSLFQVTFLIVLLNKASHVAKPRFNGVEKLTPAHVQGEFQSHIAKVHGDRDRQNFYCFFFFFFLTLVILLNK